jgi:hypothetical protein
MMLSFLIPLPIIPSRQGRGNLKIHEMINTSFSFISALDKDRDSSADYQKKLLLKMG